MSEVKQIENWAAMMPDRQVIEEFMEYLMGKCGETRLIDIHVDRELDEFHKVDRKALDRERRELLDQMRQVQPKSLIKDPANPFRGVPKDTCPNCGAAGTLKDTSAFLVELCECKACGWKDAHSGGAV